MGTYRLTIAYDGTPFAGWAAQPGLRTVQGELEGVLGRIVGESVSLSVAGRTDAGVHAWAQVASFGLEGDPPDALAHRVNSLLAPQISVIDLTSASDGFDARRDARSRTYCYRVLASPINDPFEAGRALWWPHALDREALGRCAAKLLGSHDFTAFTPTDTKHVRLAREILRAEWRTRRLTEPLPGHLLEVWIEADAFMRHMVRVLVGTMLEVAGSRRTLEDFEALLRGAPRRLAGETAPPHGLYLASVRY